jgi:lipoprotein-anchoring transpeptidase ErfK/SrfK
MVTGLNVSRTCQTMIWVTGSQSTRRVKAVFPVSTGKAATKTRRGTFSVFRSQDRWANSAEFPSARPNMYRPVYFSGGQAFHGMQADSMVIDRPASHGCVRMLHKDINRLWASGATRRGTKVKVYGDW